MTHSSGPLTPLGKSMLHSLKYSQSDVVGVFLGPSRQDPSTISHYIPLFHSRVITGTVAKTALSILDAALSSDAQIVGVFYAASTPVRGVPQVAKWLGTEICRAHGADSISCWVHDSNSDVGNYKPGHVTCYSIRWDGSETNSSISDPFSSIHVKEAVAHYKESQKLHTSGDFEITGCVDFEDHLQDPSRDWLLGI